MEGPETGALEALVKARREKARIISRVLSEDGSAAEHIPGVDYVPVRREVGIILKKYGDNVQPCIRRLSEQSGLEGLELLMLVEKAMARYVSLLRCAPLSKRAPGSHLTLPSVMEEASRDLPALLSDFEVSVKQVKKRNKQITATGKRLILAIMRRNNPYILDELERDPRLHTNFAKYEIIHAVMEHRDPKRFLLDSLETIERLSKDQVIGSTFSRFEIRFAVMNHGEAFLHSMLPFMQRGQQILNNAGLTGEAPGKTLHAIIFRESLHKGRVERLNVLMATLEKSFKAIPYSKFESEIRKMLGLGLVQIGRQLGESVAIPKVVLDLYKAQFSGLIPWHFGAFLKREVQKKKSL